MIYRARQSVLLALDLIKIPGILELRLAGGVVCRCLDLVGAQGRAVLECLGSTPDGAYSLLDFFAEAVDFEHGAHEALLWAH